MSTRLWHPFADMAVIKDDEVVIVRGEGARVWDDQGREYIDAKAALWYANVGHGRTEIAEAAAEQMRTLAGYETFDRAANRPALELADRVAELAPMEGAAVFFASGGSDAVDTAGKLALRYWSAVDRPEKHVIVHRARSYHGMNAYGTSLAGIPANAEGYGSLIADVATVAQDSTDELERAVPGERRPDRGLHRRAGDRRRRHLPPRARLLGARAGAVRRPTTCC